MTSVASEGIGGGRAVAALRVAAMLAVCAVAGTPGTARASEGAGRIAYVAFTDGYWQVWTMTPEGKHARQVTRSPADKARCSWFPDGKRLLVNTAGGRLFLVDAASGKEEPLALRIGREASTGPFRGTVDAVVSPDGNRIALSLSLPTERDNNEIWIAELPGGEARKLTHDPLFHHEPAWSPDGRTLYFVAGRGGQEHDIVRLALDTGQSEVLTAGQLYHFDVAVSPRGDLAFSSNRSGNYEIWVQRKEGQPFPVTHDPGLDGRPGWSPDGRTLVFESSRGGMPNIWKVGVGESGPAGAPTPLTHNPIGARAPTWWWPQGEGAS